jgi:hypothetical protein
MPRPWDKTLRAGTLRWIVLAIFSSAIWIDPSASAGAAKRLDEDPCDLDAVQAVCARCHANTAFLKSPRPWRRWNDVFEQMTARGATGTNEQLARVTRYFLQNLTIVNVNTSPADEIVLVLGVSEPIAEAIVARRERHKFTGLADLSGIPGVDHRRLERLKDRLLF